MDAREIAHQLGAAKPSGKGWRCQCPAHDDRDPSLSICDADNTILVNCFAGCDPKRVIEVLKDRGWWPAPNGNGNGTGGKLGEIEATYDYCDAKGKLVHQTVRYAGKKFRQRIPDGRGGWIWKLNGVERVLYNLPRIASAKQVLIVEGEKDCDTLAEWNLVATTCAEGAGKWRDAYSEHFRGKIVIILPDADETGWKHALQVVRSVLPVAKAVFIFELPDAKDVSEWKAKGGTRDQFLALYKSTKQQIPDGEALDKLEAAWRERVASKEPKKSDPQDAAAGSLPSIQANSRELRDLTGDCLEALRKVNDPPKLFVRGGWLVHITKDEHDRPSIRNASEAFLRGDITRAANFYHSNKDSSKRPVHPPLDAVRDILARPQGEWRLPPLVSLSETPLLRPDGSILRTPGYDSALRIVYCPSPQLVLPEMSEKPSQAECRAALQVLDEAIGEFPFMDESSLDNARALLLTPVLRPAIRGNVPIAIVDAPQIGTGKSLLAEVLNLILTGNPAAMRPAPGGRDDEEWRKSLTAILLAGHPITVFDNVIGLLESPSLSLAATASTFATRLLGRMEDLVLPQRTAFVVTGNNVQLSDDLTRRCYSIRIDAKSSRPWQGREFKHPDIKSWVVEHRGELLGALLTMVRGWYAARKPSAKTPVLGSFEEWCRTVGGILAYAGAPSFLGNLETLYVQADPSEQQWTAFLALLRKTQRFSVRYLIKYLDPPYVDARHAEIAKRLMATLPDEIAPLSGKPLDPRKVSWAFRKRRGRRHGEKGLYLFQEEKPLNGLAMWCVKGSKE